MYELITLLVVIVVSASLALITYYNNPHSATNKAFTIFAATIIFWATVIYLSLHPFRFEQTLFFIRLSMLAAIIMSTAVLMLSYIFPSDTLTMPKKYLIPILVVTLIGMTIAMSPYMFTDLKISDGNIEPTAGPGMLAFLISGLGYSVSGIFILARKYFHSSGIVKNQLRYVLLGITLMHICLISANFILVLVFSSSLLMPLGPVFTLAFLISAYYAIVRHRLLEIRILVTKAVSYFVLIFLIVGTFAYALFLIPTFFPANLHTSLSAGLALILAFLFNPLKNILEELTTDIFHKKAYSSQELLDTLGEIVTSSLDIQQVSTKVMATLNSNMHVSKSAFILITKDPADGQAPTIEIITTDFHPHPHLTQNQIQQLADKAKNSPLVFEELEETPTKQLLRDQHISIALPLKVKDTLHGIFVLGEKSSGDIFSQQDLDVLDIFAPQIAVAIQNSLAYSQISRFNITLKQKIKEATLDLRNANKHLRHLDKLKDEFVFIATHELKTPVTVMKGYLSMIDNGDFGEIPTKLKSALTELHQANTQLVTLVNNLLEIARAEAKTIKIITEPVLICPIVDATIRSLQTLADQKKLTLKHTCPNQNLKVLADKDRLQEILNNLLSNAIKYSDQGAITVTHEQKNNQLTTHVADQGHGISSEDQAKLFTRFFRAKETAQNPGTGLGLFIVKQLVEKMDGKISFASTLGKGTTFSFSLPLTTKPVKSTSPTQKH